MTSTSIEWTDAVWNPTTGCDQVSPGCDNCYALTMAKRLQGMGQAKYQTDGDPRTSGPGFGLAMHPDALEIPLRWRKPRRVFVNSMSDLFHPKVTDEFIARVWAVMARTPQHTYQVLTKRPKRMRALLGDASGIEGPLALIEAAPDEDTALAIYTECNPLPNVWVGVSVEDQQRAEERIPALLDTEAAVRFLSCEPLLGPVDLRRWLGYNDPGDDGAYMPRAAADQRLHWVIVGGESGAGARPMEIDWARDLVNQCTAADVPVFVKQLGARPVNHGRPVRFSHSKGADPWEWPWFLRRQQFPKTVEVPA